MKKAKTPGGKRKGAGRPKGEPTLPMNLRVPKRFKKILVTLVKTELVRLLAEEEKNGL